MTELYETRIAYGEALRELGNHRDDLVVLDADLYKSTCSGVYGECFPDRFFDLGIAEQDLISTSAGLAASGMVPYCNTFAIFLTGRCYDQIRTQIAYPALPVKLVGSSAGLTQGPDGATHQSLEDISLMRGLPNMTVIVPADDVETHQATAAIADIKGPVYMRLGRYPVRRVFGPDFQFKVGELTRLCDGDDIVLFATGHMVVKALDAARLLKTNNIAARVVNISTIKPLNRDAVLKETQGLKWVFTIEEHNIIGGLGSAVAEVLAEKAHVPMRRIGVQDTFGESGLADELLEKHGLHAEGICESVMKTIAGGV